jgi:hypothetical protein
VATCGNLLASLSVDGIGDDALNPAAPTAESINDIAVYVQGKAMTAQQRSYTQIRKLLDTAGHRLNDDEFSLEAITEQDLGQQKFDAVFSVWMRKGQSKQLQRAAATAVAANQFSFEIDPMKFLHEVANKANISPSARMSTQYTIWTPVRMRV